MVIPIRLNRIVVIFLLSCLLTTGCALFTVREEVRQSMASSIIVGWVTAPFPAEGPIIVAAYAKQGANREIAHYVMLHDWGEFEIVVAKGRYHMFAFCDTNGNLIYDAGERAGQYGDPKVVKVPAGGLVQDIHIQIPASGPPIDWQIGLPIAPDKPEKLYSHLAGEIVTLDDERFAEEHGSQGFWEGLTFYKTFGGNIFFLEPYDPGKIPVLFIHGAGGTPKGWQYLVDRMDRARFQPWFYYYSSGARIRQSSHQLIWKLVNLQFKHKFKELYITAHSMGGLVARSFIIDWASEFPYVKLLISMATPWGGDKMAEYGVRQSPGVIPCWIDMQPNGDFLQSLYRAKMPSSVSFYMFYGHRGNRNPFRSNNDGTITMSSLLDPRPQAEAKMNYAFDEDHASIIYSQQVADQFNTILNTHFALHRPSDRPAGGYVRVNFTYDYPGEGVRPRPLLVLRATDGQQKDTNMQLRAEDSGRSLGPFPSGGYTVRLLAEGTKCRQGWVPLSIESGATQDLQFAFVPDGTLAGYIVTARKGQDRAMGMPAWRRRPEEGNEIVVQSITVTGPGTHRIIHPIAGDFDKKALYKENVLSRTDFCLNGYLRLYGLAAGEYKLVIEAEGHEPYVAHQRVVPGQETTFRFFEMTPSI